MRFSMYKSHGVPEERFIPAIVCIFFSLFSWCSNQCKILKETRKKVYEQAERESFTNFWTFPHPSKGLLTDKMSSLLPL